MKGENYLASLPISQIRTDGGTQLRILTRQDVIEEYAEDIREYVRRRKADPEFREWFPPVKVFKEPGNRSHYWLVDGFHRLAAHKLAGQRSIEAYVYEGSLRDAILFAAGANKKSPLRPSQDDRRNAIRTLLTDKEWVEWPNTRIADHCGCSEGTVRKVREELQSHDTTDRVVLVNRGGATYRKTITRKRITELSPAEQAAQLNATEQTAKLQLASTTALRHLERASEILQPHQVLKPAWTSVETARRLLTA